MAVISWLTLLELLELIKEDTLHICDLLLNGQLHLSQLSHLLSMLRLVYYRHDLNRLWLLLLAHGLMRLL